MPKDFKQLLRSAYDRPWEYGEIDGITIYDKEENFIGEFNDQSSGELATRLANAAEDIDGLVDNCLIVFKAMNAQSNLKLATKIRKVLDRGSE